MKEVFCPRLFITLEEVMPEPLSLGYYPPYDSYEQARQFLSKVLVALNLHFNNQYPAYRFLGQVEKFYVSEEGD